MCKEMLLYGSIHIHHFFRLFRVFGTGLILQKYHALDITGICAWKKSFALFVFAELPKPSLGDLSDLKTLSVRHRREHNPNVLGYNYDELVTLDTVDVELVPEKKGILLKHNEYHVSSRVRNFHSYFIFSLISVKLITVFLVCKEVTATSLFYV